MFYPAALTHTTAFAMLYSLVCLGIFARSNRMTYVGLFPWVVPLLVGLQLVAGLIETYFSFFALKESTVAIFDRYASANSNYLVSTTTLNAVLFFSFSLLQRHPIFIRPNNPSTSSTLPLSSTYVPLDADEKADDLDDDSTPLAHSSDHKPSTLVDSPESGSSWFDKLTFSWPNDMFRKGATRQLGYSDLYNLTKENTPIPNWKRYLHYRKRGHSMTLAIFMSFLFSILQKTAFGISLCILRFSGPFFLQRILRSITIIKQDPSEDNMRHAYLEAIGLFFFKLLETLLTSQQMRVNNVLLMMIKSVLVGEVSVGTLCRRGKESWSKQDNKKDVSGSGSAAAEGKIVNVINADIAQVAGTIVSLTEIYELPLTLGIGIWYIYQLLGVSALLGLTLALITTPLSKKLFGKLITLQRGLSTLNDARISMITEVLQGIKAVKLFGWGTQFIKSIDEKHSSQIQYRWKLQLWHSLIRVVIDAGPAITLVTILYFYTIVFGNTLTAEAAFTSISVFNTVYNSLSQISSYVILLTRFSVSVDRINSVLGQGHIQKLEERIALDSNDRLGFECADLEWEPPINGDAFSLKNIDVQFPIGGLSIVAGSTGSGKSSLLLAFIGEMTLTRGRVLLPTVDSRILAANDRKYRDVIELSNEGLAISDIAYVAQEPWLRNATIRKNILFGEPYNRDRYEAVLHACALKPDLRILKAGDMSEIGERGVTLSGGQKQRVALARAVYSNRRILLIDDCLSAVDAHTGKHILMECLLNKTSLMQGRTCVLVTHHVSMCLPFAHYVVMMHKGSIVLKGTPKELQMQDERQQDDDGNEYTKDAINMLNDTKSEDEYTLERLQKIAEQKGIDPNSNLSTLQGILVKDEERENGQVKFEVWKTFTSVCGGRLFWIFLVISLVVGEAINALITYWIRLWVSSSHDSFADSFINIGRVKQQLQRHSAVYWLGWYFSFSMINCLWRIARQYVTTFGSITASKNVHRQLLRSVVHATPRFFDTTPIGRIINRFSSDLQKIDQTAVDSLVNLISGITAILTTFVIVSSVIPMFIIAAVAILIAYICIGIYYLKTVRELKRLRANSASPVTSLFGEMVNGISTIRAFGAKKLYIQEALNRTCINNRLDYALWFTERWLSIRLNFLGLLVSFISAIFIFMNLDRMDAGLAGFLLSYATSFLSYTLWIIRSYSNNELNMNSVERVIQYTKVEQEAALDSAPQHKPPLSWPTKGDVQVENLVAEYVPSVPILHSISFSVKHGEKIGVVGRTGAGKSTLSLALLRFIEASSGRIMLDGVDISKIGLEDLRRNITIIPQDPVLFKGTIRFNLDPFSEYPEEIVWDALRRTHLVRESSIHSSSSVASINASEDSISDTETLAIEHMSGVFGSLDAEIKENGQNLSLGQRQLVALARALVRRSRLIIMDEATASVDFDTDDRIQRTIRGYEFANSTLFCIAHRLRTIIDYDRVLVLDKGKVAEFDTPYNLLQNKDGIFRSMCEKSGEYEYLVAASSGKDANKRVC
ncbi:P-loop containing nucleoside triphosphate hydrolase protein [Coemansia spiralis]|nr:P-loop containing nucleoside triphosphate hydrolase protein [Coemansia spiralis]